jgi:hypothetical protein
VICRILILLSISFAARAQNLPQVKEDVNELASPEMHGRGYVNGGLKKASAYLQDRLSEIGLNPMVQTYGFQVNTFPSRSKLRIGKRKLSEGIDYLIDPRSGPYRGRAVFARIDSADLVGGDAGLIIGESFPVIDPSGIDTPEEVNVQHDFVTRSLQRGPVILLKEKLTWSVGTQQYDHPLIEVLADVFQEENAEAMIDIRPESIRFASENIIAKVEGKNSDSLIVFTAHYDHLGRMGKALFPGASDNASGTAMLLDLAARYVEDQPAFDTYFIFFSGEEAGLKGSRYFVDQPLFELDRVKLLVNLDLMGSAADGITIVNGRLYPDRMRQLAAINTEKELLPKVKLRGKAANSDHYWFSEMGVPAIFIYTMGNAKAYHDIYDVPEGLDWANYHEVFTLLVEFIETL